VRTRHRNAECCARCGGILVKGGGPLEALGTVSAIAFDKTGTLTRGEPVLTDVVAAAGISEDELLRVTLAVEQASDHPIARRLDGPPPADANEVTAVNGKGVTGRVGGELVMIGNAALFEEVGLPAEIASTQDALERQGRTTSRQGLPRRSRRNGHAARGGRRDDRRAP